MQYGSALRAKVLILGIADRDYSYSLRDIPNSIRMIFAQNLDFVDGRFHVMPLGLEILSISVNGFTEYVDLRFRSIAKAPKILICPLNRHRFWETLYRGSIPIVKASTWSRHISILGIPVCQIDDWSIDWLEKVLEYGAFQEFDPLNIPSLWNQLWESRIFSGI